MSAGYGLCTCLYRTVVFSSTRFKTWFQLVFFSPPFQKTLLNCSVCCGCHYTVPRVWHETYTDMLVVMLTRVCMCVSRADSIEDDFELSTVCHRPESMDKLQEQTKFTKKELQVLYRGFKNVGQPEGKTTHAYGTVIYSSVLFL